MMKILQQASLLAVLVAMGLTASSCVLSTPGVTTDAAVIYSDEARRGPVYDYYYYPNTDVYYDPSVRIYYWKEGSNWRRDRVLPRHYRLDDRHRYRFRADVREPYRVHDRVIIKYREQNRDGRDRYDRDRNRDRRGRDWDRDRDRDRDDYRDRDRDYRR